MNFLLDTIQYNNSKIVITNELLIKFRALLTNVTDMEVTALKEYAWEYYSYINYYLDKGSLPKQIMWYKPLTDNNVITFGDLESKVRGDIEILDKLFVRAPSIDRPITVYRGIRNVSLFDGKISGSVINCTNFLSTSIDLLTAFSHFTEYETPLLTVISVPKNKKYLLILNEFSPNADVTHPELASINKSEFEILFARGEKLRVNHQRNIVFGKRTIAIYYLDML